MKSYDVIVIGGGSAGLMASVAAARFGASVLLLDKGAKLGRKLGISGGGRCNVTNAKETEDLIAHIPGNGRFLYSAFQHFNNRDIMAFFEGLGIALKEEDNGRMFPVSDKAASVVNTLIGEVHAARRGHQNRHSRIGGPLFGTSRIRRKTRFGGHLAGKRGHRCDRRQIGAALCGSTGDGYPWAQAAGHTITELYPTEVPIVSRESWIASKELQGLSLRDVELSVWTPKGKK